MKKNKLTIRAFEKFIIANNSKAHIKGGNPEGGIGEMSFDDYSTGTGENSESSPGGPGSTTLSTGVIKPTDPFVLAPIKLP